MAGWTSWAAPTPSFGGLQFQKQTAPQNDWSKYLGNLSNEQDAAALGLNGPDNADTQQTSWNRYLAMMSNQMSPNALNGLNQNRWRVNSAFEQARASQPDVRYAQFLGGVDPTNTVQAWSPQTAFRPVTFRRVRVSGG